MYNLESTEKSGFTSLIVLICTLVIAASLFVTTKLVQQNQENRSSAAGVTLSNLSHLYFNESVSTCYVGSECKVIIGVNSASDKINGVDLVGTYDSTLLKLTSITQSDPFALKDINGKCLVPTGKTGTFKATCFANDLKKSIQANGKLVDVTFIPQKTGSSKLNFSCVNGNTSDSNITTSDTETDIISCKDNNEALINILTCKSGDRRCVDNGMRCVVAPCYSLDTQICVNGNWKKDGTCANSCTQDGYCDQKPISTPTPIPICGLIATPNTLSLKIGERATVKLSNDYSVKNCALPTALGINTWSSSNEKVATVEGETGVITGVSAGTATIKVLEYGIREAIVKVTVMDKENTCKSGDRRCVDMITDMCVTGFCPSQKAQACSNGSWKDDGICNFGCDNGKCLKNKFDINEDGVVNSVDFSIAKSSIVTNDLKGDVNQDNVVNSIDLNLIRLNLYSTSIIIGQH